jgi:hypothetical protein
MPKNEVVGGIETGTIGELHHYIIINTCLLANTSTLIYHNQESPQGSHYL